MKLTDWVNSARSVTQEEMSTCATKGECHQCGLCCVAFEDKLPIEIPARVDESVQLHRKAIFTVCPHLTLDGAGGSNCAAHEMKDHPHLVHCKNWKGTNRMEHPAFGNISYFQLMISNFWLWAVHMATAEDLLAADKMIEKGLIPGVIYKGMNIHTALLFLRRVLTLPRLPHRILEGIRFREMAVLSGPGILEMIKTDLDLNKPELSHVETEFVQRYL